MGAAVLVASSDGERFLKSERRRQDVGVLRSTQAGPRRRTEGSRLAGGRDTGAASRDNGLFAKGDGRRRRRNDVPHYGVAPGDGEEGERAISAAVLPNVPLKAHPRTKRGKRAKREKDTKGVLRKSSTTILTNELGRRKGDDSKTRGASEQDN